MFTEIIMLCGIDNSSYSIGSQDTLQAASAELFIQKDYQNLIAKI